MVLVSCRNIRKEYEHKCVLKEINLDIKSNSRIGLVGKNGAGKSTLANIIFGSLEADKGEVVFYKDNIKIGYLLQTGQYDFKICNGSDKHSYYTTADFYKMTSNLGLEKVNKWSNSRFQGLSGGERIKLALANIWSFNPHILILDEPTNHLDFKGMEWLINQLKTFNGSVLTISHDRYFLDEITNEIVEIEEGILQFYKGNYSFYRDEKKRRYNNQLHQYMVQKKKQEKIESEINNLRNWSSKGHKNARKVAIKNGMKFGGKEFYRSKAKKFDKRIKSKIKRLEKMQKEGISKPKDEPKVFFNFDDTKKGGRHIIEVKKISKRYEEKVLFQNSSFCIQRGEKIGLIGDNGCGKTTLLKVIMKEETVDNGEVWVSPSCKIAYLSQDTEDLDLRLSILEVLDLKGLQRIVM